MACLSIWFHIQNHLWVVLFLLNRQQNRSNWQLFWPALLSLKSQSLKQWVRKSSLWVITSYVQRSWIRRSFQISFRYKLQWFLWFGISQLSNLGFQVSIGKQRKIHGLMQRSRLLNSELISTEGQMGQIGQEKDLMRQHQRSVQ